MVRTDPFTPERKRYECVSCGARQAAEEHVDQCAECGGRVRNVAVPRE